MNLNKRVDNVKGELNSFKLEVKDELTNVKVEVANLSMRIERVEMKFGIVEEQNTNANKRVDKLEVELKEQKAEIKEQRTEIREIRAEQKNFIENLMKNFAKSFLIKKFYKKQICQKLHIDNSVIPHLMRYLLEYKQGCRIKFGITIAPVIASVARQSKKK